MEDTIRDVLEHCRTWAVVGCSPSRARDSHRIAAMLAARGYCVIPVNPNCDEVLGLRSYASLAEIDEPVDVVDVFRRSSEAGRHVDEAVAIGARAVWLQLGVVDEAAAGRARSSGLLVVMDRCPMIEYPKLLRAGQIPQQPSASADVISGN